MIRMKLSIKGKVLLFLFIITITIFVLIELFLLKRSHSALIESLDNELQTRAEGLASLTFIKDDGEIELDFADEIMPEYDDPRPSAYFILFHEDTQKEIERSNSLKNKHVTIPQDAHLLKANTDVTWDGTVGKKNVRFLATLKIIRPEYEKNEEEYWRNNPDKHKSNARHTYRLFVVGKDKTAIEETFGDIVKLTATSLGSGLCLLLLASWFAVSRSLISLEKLEKDVQAINSFNLHPVTIPKEKEIAEVATTLNSVLLELKESFERERRFTADVAHELRTPLSEILTLSEVVLKWPSSSNEEERSNFEDILAAARQMQNVVINLLTLARCDAGVLTHQNDKVMIRPLIDSLWSNYSQLTAEKRITFECHADFNSYLNTDEDLFKTIVDNLISNAIEYAPSGGDISLEVQGDKDIFSLSVTNTVDNLTAEDVSHLFNRFWRKDSVRTPDGKHNGLGLSLVQSLSVTLGLTIHAYMSQHNELTINLTNTRR
ncbi:sensor histidine kinase [candidate division CSSED10-310 bacterium]|uniref:histidine kinase n=1 Tax=candidate division CSSED10-310 bacterium TaxID=2855610 RepID=A0ABV6YWY7_UNCC1